MSQPSVSAAEDQRADSPYGAAFWHAYLANTCMMVAISLLFRYSDFITLLGGTEWHLGWIVGLGMTGSLLMRVGQGVGIDRYGPRRLWLWSSFFFVVSLLGHVLIEDIHGLPVYALRILYQTSVAGIFGASITYISGRAPVARMAEVIGTLGTSGFVGMSVGSVVGDFIFRGLQPGRARVEQMFLLAAALGAVSFGFAWLATRGQQPPQRRRQPPLGWLLRRYHPGPVLLMGVVMGWGIGLPPIFLREYTKSLGIGTISSFFVLYPWLAFATRMAIRKLPERIGLHLVILLGTVSLVVAMLLFIVVTSAWQLIFPALFLGVAHAFLFPAVIAGGSTMFPARYRGLGTTLMLATFDMGALIGAPTVGALLRLARVHDLPPYPTMFLAVAMILGLAGLTYGIRPSSRPLGRATPRLSRARKLRQAKSLAESAAKPANASELGF